MLFYRSGLKLASFTKRGSHSPNRATNRVTGCHEIIQVLVVQLYIVFSVRTFYKFLTQLGTFIWWLPDLTKR